MKKNKAYYKGDEILFGKPIENAFKVPENYFSNLENEVMKNISELPDFAKSSSVNPFKVPENYFEKLPIEIQDRISKKENSGIITKVEEWLAQLLQPKFSLSLITALVVVFLSVKFFTKTKYINQQMAYGISADELSASNYLDEIDESLLVESLDKLPAKTDEEKSIEDYLINNHIDLSEISNEEL